MRITERRLAYADEEWNARLRRPAHRVAELQARSSERSAPERWRLIEAWTIAAHGPYMAVAGGFHNLPDRRHQPSARPRAGHGL